MDNEKIKKKIYHHFENIISSIDFIQELLSRLNIKCQEDFLNHIDKGITEKAQIKGIENELFHITESVRAVKELDDNIYLKSRDEIIKSRAIFVHAYWKVNYEIVWNITDIHLPELKNDILAIINDYKI